MHVYICPCMHACMRICVRIRIYSSCIQFISNKVYTIETNMKHISKVSKTYLFNELRCVEPSSSITSQITQLHAA